MADNIPFDEDDEFVSPEDIKAYLEEEKQEESSSIIPEDVQELLKADAEDNTAPEEPERVELEPDKTFEENRKEAFEQMVVTVKDWEVPITDDDKAMYIKCLLNSTPVELDIKAKNGTSGRCRALSVYESDVAVAALAHYLKIYPQTDYMFQESLLQQYRAAMQLMSYCSKSLDYISYERGKNGTKEDHAKDLYERSQTLLDVPGPVYGMYIRLLNVFQFKINKLQEAAFNSDFWFPGDSD